MRSNALKRKLQNGEVVIGSFLYVPSGKLAEMVAMSGFDFITIDQEHGGIGPERTEEIVLACEAARCTPLVRVRHLHQHCILQALDSGAMGVHVPNIRNAPQAQKAASLCRYAPLGTRGLAGVRAADYGMREPLADYCSHSNREVLLIVHIEDMEAVRNLDSILDSKAADIYFVGPSDLSNSLGRPGCMDPEIAAIVDETIQRIVRSGNTAGTFVNDPNAARRYADLGVRYIATHALRHMATASQGFLSAVR